MTSLTNRPLSARFPVKQKSDDLTFYKRYTVDLETTNKSLERWLGAVSLFAFLGWLAFVGSILYFVSVA